MIIKTIWKFTYKFESIMTMIWPVHCVSYCFLSWCWPLLLLCIMNLYFFYLMLARAFVFHYEVIILWIFNHFIDLDYQSHFWTFDCRMFVPLLTRIMPEKLWDCVSFMNGGCCIRFVVAVWWWIWWFICDFICVMVTWWWVWLMIYMWFYFALWSPDGEFVNVLGYEWYDIWLCFRFG